MVIFHWIHFLFLVLESNGIESPDSIAVRREVEEQHHKSLVVSAPSYHSIYYMYIIHGEWATRNSRAASWCRERERVHIVIVETEWRVGSHQGPLSLLSFLYSCWPLRKPCHPIPIYKSRDSVSERKAAALMTWRAIEHATGSHLQLVPSPFSSLFDRERRGC